ncbi:uncharacterized protein G2W53_017971 [Senna tora]|uniref:Uncharacterized protein n=1 Tax=Senna tora TaxID=362788 RepID=A0A834WKY6_9FABA|nr:uncharacterized protein G2W53_017971 [Senna tora]
MPSPPTDPSPPSYVHSTIQPDTQPPPTDPSPYEAKGHILSLDLVARI